MNIAVERPRPRSELFRLPSGSALVLTPPQLEAAGFLEDAARRLEPVAALSGDAGCGKTTVLGEAVAGLEAEGRRVLRISNFVAGPLNLHRTICSLLGVERPHEQSADEIAPALHRALAEAGYAEPPVLAVDDAQSLLPETLEYLSMLSELREGGKPSFCILLVGRPGFVRQARFSQLHSLQKVTTEAATKIAEQILARCGAKAPMPIVQDMVHAAAGNLRRLDQSVRDRIEQGKAGGITRASATTRATPAVAADQIVPSGSNKKIASRAPWLAVPVVLGLGAAMLLHRGPPASPALPTAPPTAPTVQAATAPLPVPSQTASAPVAAIPTKIATPPAPPEHLAMLAVPPAALPAPPEDHFRIYNIGPCRRRICHHWSVADLDVGNQFVADVDVSALHLAPALARSVRVASVELTIAGAVVATPSGGRRVVASSLTMVEPHHRGRATETALPPDTSLSAPAQAAAPLPAPIPAGVAPDPAPLRSPPPGFLHFPSNEAIASPPMPLENRLASEPGSQDLPAAGAVGPTRN